MLKGIFDDLDITDVHVHQGLFLLVVVHDLVEAEFQKIGWIGKFLGSSVLFLGGHVLCAGLLILIIVLLLQFLLQIHDLVLKIELIDVMLGFKS